MLKNDIIPMKNFPKAKEELVNRQKPSFLMLKLLDCG